MSANEQQLTLQTWFSGAEISSSGRISRKSQRLNFGRMGRKLDALLRRNRHFKPSKFKSLVNVANSRSSVLKNQHQSRSSNARSDVVQLLNLGLQDRALLRVEILIKENNMLDALEMIEGYCYLLTERLVLLQNSKECPGEVKEAISSLIFAASRSGEFPELLEIRRIFELKFGKDFASCAVELRNNCGVSPKMIQKFSTRQANTENKLKVLQEIASEQGIILHLEEEPTKVIKEKLDPNQKQEQQEAKQPTDLDNTEIIKIINNLPEDIIEDKSLSESVRAKKFKDVGSAAREAFKAAAYAASAARAAIELSRTESQDVDGDHQDDCDLPKNSTSDLDSSHAPKTDLEASISSSEIDHSDDKYGFERIHPDEKYSSESEGEEIAESNQVVHIQKLDESPEKPATESTSTVPNLDSDVRNIEKQSSNPELIFQNELECEKLIGDGNDEVASKKEVSDKNIANEN